MTAERVADVVRTFDLVTPERAGHAARDVRDLPDGALRGEPRAGVLTLAAPPAAGRPAGEPAVRAPFDIEPPTRATTP